MTPHSSRRRPAVQAAWHQVTQGDNLRAVSLSLMMIATSCGMSTPPVQVPGKAPVAPSGIATQANKVTVQALPGVFFLPPITKDPGTLGPLEETARVNIELFKLEGDKVREPSAGPAFSTKAGTIVKEDGHYHANWKTADSKLANGALVRIELRLDTVPAGSAACNAGASLDAGCLAFIDAKLWRTQAEANKNGGKGSEILNLVNGQNLPIKFHVNAGAINLAPKVQITAPAEGFSLKEGEPLKFTATASDFEDGDLTGKIEWTIDGIGKIGEGGAAEKALPVGTYTVTATARDSLGASGSAKVQVQVTPAAAPPKPPVLVGGTPNAFTKVGGLFTIAMVLEDEAGKSIGNLLNLGDFTFQGVQLAPVAKPDQPVASGTAIPVDLVTDGQQTTSAVSMMIAIDQSGSMSSNDPRNLRYDAARQLIDTLTPPDEVGVLSLDTVTQKLTTDYALAKTKVNQGGGSSDIYGGVRIAAQQLQSAQHAHRAIVALTDGETGLGNFEASINDARAVGAQVYTIGLGQNLNYAQLQELASRTGGAFGHVTNASDLQSVFDAIGKSITVGGTRLTARASLDGTNVVTGTYLLTGTVVSQVLGKTFETPFSIRVYIDANVLVNVPPKLQNVSPASGSTAGGTQVSISGSDFSRVNAVTFGGVPAQRFFIDTNNRITAVAPAGTAGKVALELSSPEGKSNTLEYTYQNTAPTLTSPVMTPSTPAAGQEVAVSWSAGDLEGDKVDCVVDFGDGQQTSVVNCDGSQSVKHTYTAAGTYTVRVTVTDSVGNVLAKTNRLTVIANATPRIDRFAYSPTSPLAGQEVRFTWDGSDLEKDTISCTLAFGDGQSQTVTNCSGSQVATYTYGTAGTFTVKLSMVDAQNNRTEQSTGIEIKPVPENRPPVISGMTVDPSSSNAGQPVRVAWSTHDPEGDAVNCSIDFGDGQNQKLTSCEGTQQLTHVYSTPGTYAIKVLAIDSKNASAEITQSVTVQRVAEMPQIALLAVQPAHIEVGDRLSVSWQVTNPNRSLLTCTLQVDSQVLRTIEDCSTTTSAEITLTNEGTQEITLAVSDPAAPTVSATKQVLVHPNLNLQLEGAMVDQATVQGLLRQVQASSFLPSGSKFSSDHAQAVTYGTNFTVLYLKDLQTHANFDQIIHEVFFVDGRIANWVRLAKSTLRNEVALVNVLYGTSFTGPIEGRTTAQDIAANLVFLQSPMSQEGRWADQLSWTRTLGKTEVMKPAAMGALSTSCSSLAGDYRTAWVLAMTAMPFTVAPSTSSANHKDFFIGLFFEGLADAGGFANAFGVYNMLPYLASMYATHWFVRYRDCLSSQGVNYSNKVIAVVAPPLPASTTVFVVSIPDNITVYATSNVMSVYDILTAALPNAVLTYEALYNPVVPDSANVDPIGMTIRATTKGF